ncbi:MAG: Sjogren's syndrome/scleroderma autoantigen 1 family protein [Candidatus Thorarchaeota archaeon]
MSDNDDTSVKRMAELLRQGATMLADACPQCGSPLFKVKDDIYCAKCDRRIVYAQSDEEVEVQAVKILIPGLRETLINKLKALNEVVDNETDTEVLTKLANLMVLLLQALHKLESMSA